MRIAKAGYLGYFLKMCMSENRTTAIRRSQGPGVYLKKVVVSKISLSINFVIQELMFLRIAKVWIKATTSV